MRKDDYVLELVLTAGEMAEVDRRTIEDIGIPGMVLMENAGRKVVSLIKKVLGEVAGKRIVILCGKGNNGGDGFVVARYLYGQGAVVDVIRTSPAEQSMKDAGTNLQILDNLGIPHAQYVPELFDEVLARADLVVDAILGTGVSGALRGEIAAIVQKVTRSKVAVVAVDLPTGMNTDSGEVAGDCIQADHTVTMGYLKRGLLFSPGREHAGQVHVAEIGFPDAIVQSMHIDCCLTTRGYIKKVLPERATNLFKNRSGQVLVLAGSVGMTGAASLTASATLRAGAGLTILAAPGSLNDILEEKLTEVMTLPLPETEARTVGRGAKVLIEDKLQWADAVAVGPGLGTHDEIALIVKWILEKFEGTVVLDADGLNCLAGDSQTIVKAKGEMILTPHPGELARLTGIKMRDILTDPVNVARKVAAKLQAVLVLKGAPTVTAAPDGQVHINSTGNPGMATAGMGDVLTGIIAGLSAQGLSPVDAAVAGVYLHGCAGDMARSAVGEAALLATDVLQNLAGVSKDFEVKSRCGVEVI